MIRLSRKTFIQLLVGKSICEALVVASVAVGLFLATTNLALHGQLEVADAQTISGWVTDDSAAGQPVEVQLFIDDKFIEQKTANESRAGEHQADRAQGDGHEFAFKTPALTAGEHEAKVYVLHRGASLSRRTLQILGSPIRFRSNATP